MRPKNILVTLGGGGNSAVTTTIVDALKSLKTLGLWIKVIGMDSSASQLAQDMESSVWGRFEFLDRAAKMEELMAWADMAISGGGTTCWEMAYMGCRISY